ncbi:hypothetical protein [uncultured Maribacter sp.]|uniref:hypothetical protein n=1 Tax=uncultured Maribacter sp. TaxID=431308 RepID=UPI0026396A9C|nr:hypothetical protein [uncultured Maribacter sp.]
MILKRILVIAIFGVVFLGCETDSLPCEEGYIELPGQNGPVCVPEGEVRAVNMSTPLSSNKL